MTEQTFTTNLDQTETTTLEGFVEDAAVSKARAQLYTALAGLVTVGTLVALAVAVPVVVAVYRWAF